jgi:hypothetical protein
MRPLNGSYYVNIFAHCRPVGDPQWYTRQNPPGTPDPLIDVGECHSDGIRAFCDKANLPFLSPSLETIQNPNDLYDWWVKVSPPPTKSSVDDFPRGVQVPDL